MNLVPLLQSDRHRDHHREDRLDGDIAALQLHFGLDLMGAGFQIGEIDRYDDILGDLQLLQDGERAGQYHRHRNGGKGCLQPIT